ncbi:heterokaryon incompatibility protein-domain-containing protein [Paraphoma chrysanthemicola]|uniref:Heterokaryon incompatibility protein-domain-containing protein n=1 Tax=Paraphoma chrysanthemicola TaxID=798071 RepID=A0A8K0R8I0_9PLEO|nr:heterokaryon incompatibility protein-domain-containing protein [Paraphoma chrysanthemicola]
METGRQGISDSTGGAVIPDLARDSTGETSRTMFKHAPIDLQSDSIRLVEVLPFDPVKTEGPIQCRIRHATTATRYTCLSYVWGDEGSEHTIMINGQPFLVRQNLWDFLVAASKCKATGSNFNVDKSDLDLAAEFRSLWIDALCIDQDFTRERNHQVQQMGKMYSKALRVLAWFGKNNETCRQFRSIRRCRDVDLVRRSDAREIVAEFCQDAYWRRAWITQETVLARELWYMTHEEAVSNDNVWRGFGPARQNFSPGSARGYLPEYKALYDIRERYMARTLVENILLYHEKECADARDKVYSLLSISTDGVKIEADYNISTSELAKSVCRTLAKRCPCYNSSLWDALIAMTRDSMDDVLIFSFVASPSKMFDGACGRCAVPIGDRSLINGYKVHGGDIYCLECDASKSAGFIHGHVFRGRKKGADGYAWYSLWARKGKVEILHEGFKLSVNGVTGAITCRVSLSGLAELETAVAWIDPQMVKTTQSLNWGLDWQVLP